MLKRLATFIATLTLGVFGFILFDTASASAATLTWTGGAGGIGPKISDADNWDSALVPQEGDTLVFPNISAMELVNVDVNTYFRSIIIGDDTEYEFGGSGILNTDKIEVGKNTDVSIPNHVRMGANFDAVISVADGGQLSMHGRLETQSAIVWLEGDDPVSLGAGTISFRDYHTSNASTHLKIWGGVSVTFNEKGTSGTAPHTVEIGEDSILDTDAGDILGTNKTILKEGGVLLLPAGFSTDKNVQLENNASIKVKANANDLSNLIVLAGNVQLNGNASYDDQQLGIDLKLTGNISGSGKLTPVAGNGGDVIIAPASGKKNTSSMPSGATKPSIKITTISDATTGVLKVLKNNTVVVNGKRGDTTVQSGGTLKGTGSVGVLTVLSGGRVAPGESPGCLSAGNTTFNEDSHFDVELAGTTVCSEYDQLKVTGTVNLGNANLNVSFLDNFKPATGNTFIVLENDDTDAVTGTFKDLPEGATFTIDGVVFKISYKGGDGNDVALTVESVPGTPNTGMQLLTSNPLLTLALTTVSAAGLVVFTRKYSQFVKG